MITRSTSGTLRQMSELMQLAASRLQESQMAAGSLDRLRNIYDHPLDAAQAMRLDADLEEHSALTERLTGVTTELATVDGALAQAANLLIRAKEIAVAMESETVNADERATASVEVDALFESMATVGNTHYNGIYLFAGTAIDTLPFLSDGSYVGGGQGRSVPLLDSETLLISYTGDAIFHEAGADVFQSLDELRTALLADDTAAIETASSNIDAAHDHLVSQRGTYGAAHARVEDLIYASEDATIALEGFIGNLRDLDMVEAFSDLVQAQNTYEAAATTLSTILNTNIFRYL